MNLSDDLYREIILENYKSTRNRHPLDTADYRKEGVNPSCGDDIELYLKADGEQITDASFEGIGCSICIASANMLCNAIKGMSVKEAEDLIERVKGMLTRNETPEFPDAAEDLEAIQGVANYPVRIKCAMLSWNTLNQILAEIRSGSPEQA